MLFPSYIICTTRTVHTKRHAQPHCKGMNGKTKNQKKPSQCLFGDLIDCFEESVAIKHGT